jgi:hypothetical protein
MVVCVRVKRSLAAGANLNQFQHLDHLLSSTKMRRSSEGVGMAGKAATIDPRGRYNQQHAPEEHEPTAFRTSGVGREQRANQHVLVVPLDDDWNQVVLKIPETQTGMGSGKKVTFYMLYLDGAELGPFTSEQVRLSSAWLAFLHQLIWERYTMLSF